VSIEKVSEIRDLWRAIFQLNADGGKDRYKIQARIDAAFLTLRELKTITEHLRNCEAARESHLDSEGVNFHIGQVVQPKDYKWRGVIAGWGKTEESLHQGGTAKSSIHYTLLQDSGDSILMGKQNKNQVPIYKISKDRLNKYQMLMVEQSDFRLLDDTLLCRVRNKDYSAFFMATMHSKIASSPMTQQNMTIAWKISNRKNGMARCTLANQRKHQMLPNMSLRLYSRWLPDSRTEFKKRNVSILF
jgi:Hemimethylated DNA-binding protein YccV like